MGFLGTLPETMVLTIGFLGVPVYFLIIQVWDTYIKCSKKAKKGSKTPANLRAWRDGIKYNMGTSYYIPIL